MRIFNDTTDILRIAIFSSALIAMISYGKWHFWWRSGFGRALMAALLSIAVLSLVQLLHVWPGVDGDFNSVADDAAAGFEIAALAGVLTWVSYTLFRVAATSLRRARHPGEAADQGRRHLERTPQATREDIEKLLACWDETHTTPPRQSSPRN